MDLLLMILFSWNLNLLILMDHPTRWALVSRKLISNQRCIVESIMAPFFGGLIDTLGIIIIALFGFGIVASLLSCGLGKDTIFSTKKGDDDNRSVHYKYDVNDLNLDVVTSPNGILGGKGHYPRSRLDENSHPNSYWYWDSPKLMTSDVHSPPSKQPMGIEKMETVSLM